MTDERTTCRRVGRYALFGPIAAGGMAVVHFGRLGGVAGFSRVVAIKKMHAQYADSSEFVAAFIDEARLASRVQHPNVLPTLDVVSADGEFLIVMEYVNGEALSELLRASRETGERVPARVAASVMIHVLYGLHAAHEARDESERPLGIVHRDVSPHNVLVGVDGVARVLDFGVARAIGRLQKTDTGQVKGKVAYMAPEQVLAHEVTRQADVYAAGVVLWETLTGRRLFEKESAGGVIYDILEGPIDPPSAHRSDVPPALDRIVARALERNTRARFATARDFALALERDVEHATPSEVGAWVERLAHEKIAARRLAVAQIERVALSGVDGDHIGSVRDVSVRTASATDVTVTHAALGASPRRARGARTIAIAIGIAALAALGVVTFVAGKAPSPRTLENAASAASTTSTVIPPVSSAIANTPPASTASPAPPPSVAIAPHPAAPSPAARAPLRPSATGSARLPSSVDCDPPYVEGADGIRRPKQGCY